MACSICQGVIRKEVSGWEGGHNAAPVNDGRCCASCNDAIVLPARIKQMAHGLKNFFYKEEESIL